MGLQSMTSPLDPGVPKQSQGFPSSTYFHEWWYMAVDENFNVFV
jgi:hypothetical protein